MRLYLGCDGAINKSIKNNDVYLLEFGTFMVFQEVFEKDLISLIFNLKGQYDLLIYRNYEIKNFLNSEISSILSNLKKIQKFKIEQSIFILISENVKINLIKKFNKNIYSQLYKPQCIETIQQINSKKILLNLPIMQNLGN
jgi:hypothetical protein